jgi:hypothetical protein
VSSDHPFYRAECYLAAHLHGAQGTGEVRHRSIEDSGRGRYMGLYCGEAESE